jgi:uncharacterized protein (DUF983 family)
MKINKSKFYGILHQKCPRCREGNMFERPAFSTKFTRMNQHCPSCGLDLIQEPAYYFGAMYFSYAFQVAIFVAVYFGLRYTINPDTSTYVTTLIAASILILPWNYRLSRVLWISLFIPYRKSELTQHENN